MIGGRRDVRNASCAASQAEPPGGGTPRRARAPGGRGAGTTCSAVGIAAHGGKERKSERLADTHSSEEHNS
jgi:hypothetical protein